MISGTDNNCQLKLSKTKRSLSVTSMCMRPSPCKNYWNFVKMCPGNLLEICSVAFVDSVS